MDLPATQAIPLSDYESEQEIDDEVGEKLPVAYLKVLLHRGFPEREFPIYEGCNLIGRDPSCNIHIDQKALSKKHAFIEIVSGQHFLVDKGSKNKTRRNKIFLVAEARYEIKTGDKLTFADVDCVYKIKERQPVATSTVIPESGSETGSELVPSQPDKQTNLCKEKASANQKVTVEDSDPSSDLLQTTQHFPTGNQNTNKSSNGALGVANTLFYATDSDDSDNETPVVQPFRQNKTLVAETPAATRPRKVSGETFIPDSQAAADTTGLSEGPTETILYDDHSDSDNEEKQRLAMQPTQAFGGDIVQESDEEDNTESAGFNAQTQLFPVHSPGEKDSKEKKGNNKSGTVAYDMDIESTQTAEEIRSEKSKKTTLTAGDAEQTAKYDMELESTQTGQTKFLNDSNASTDSDNAPTQTYEEVPAASTGANSSVDKPKPKIDLGIGGTMAFDYEEDSSDDEPIIPLVKPKFKESSKKDAESDSDVATQVFDADETAPIDDADAATQVPGDDNDETQVVGGVENDDNDETQAMEPDDADETLNVSTTVKKTPKGSTKSRTPSPVANTVAATQLFGSHAKGGNSPKDTEAPTQCFDDMATQVFQEPCAKKGKGGNAAKKSEKAPTQCADDIATQVFPEPAKRKGRSGRKSRSPSPVPSDGETQVLGAAETQVIEMPTKSGRGRGRKKKEKKDTDNVDAMETQMIEVSSKSNKGKGAGKGKGKRKGRSPSPVASDDNMETQVLENDQPPVFSGEDDQTQVLGDQNNDETQVIGAENDQTQVFDEADAETQGDDDGTQSFTVSDNNIEGGDTFKKPQPLNQTVELSVFKSPMVPGKKSVKGMHGDDATQLFAADGSETQCFTKPQTPAITVSKTTKVGKGKQTDTVFSPERMQDFDPSECSTQMFDSGDKAKPVMRDFDEPEDQPTQIFLSGADLSTQNLDDSREIDNDGFVKPMIPPAKQNKAVVGSSSPKPGPSDKANTDDICTQAYEIDTDEEDNDEVDYATKKKSDATDSSEDSNQVDLMGPTLPAFTDNLETQAYDMQETEELKDKDVDSPVFSSKTKNTAKTRNREQKVFPEDTDMLATQAYEVDEVNMDTEEEEKSEEKELQVNTDDMETQAYVAEEEEEEHISKLEMELSHAESNTSKVEDTTHLKTKKGQPLTEQVESSQPELDQEPAPIIPNIILTAESNKKMARGRPSKRRNSGRVEDEGVSDSKKTKTQVTSVKERNVAMKKEAPAAKSKRGRRGKAATNDVEEDADEVKEPTTMEAVNETDEKEIAQQAKGASKRGRKATKKDNQTAEVLQDENVSSTKEEAKERQPSTSRRTKRGQSMDSETKENEKVELELTQKQETEITPAGKRTKRGQKCATKIGKDEENDDAVIKDNENDVNSEKDTMSMETEESSQKKRRGRPSKIGMNKEENSQDTTKVKRKSGKGTVESQDSEEIPPIISQRGCDKDTENVAEEPEVKRNRGRPSKKNQEATTSEVQVESKLPDKEQVKGRRGGRKKAVVDTHEVQRETGIKLTIIRKLSESSESGEKDTFEAISSKRISSPMPPDKLEVPANTTRRTRNSSVGSSTASELSETQDIKHSRRSRSKASPSPSPQVPGGRRSRSKESQSSQHEQELSSQKGKGKGKKTKEVTSKKDNEMLSVESEENSQRGGRRSSARRSMSPLINAEQSDNQTDKSVKTIREKRKSTAKNASENITISVEEEINTDFTPIISKGNKNMRRSIIKKEGESQSSQLSNESEESSSALTKKKVQKNIKDAQESQTSEASDILMNEQTTSKTTKVQPKGKRRKNSKENPAEIVIEESTDTMEKNKPSSLKINRKSLQMENEAKIETEQSRGTASTRGKITEDEKITNDKDSKYKKPQKGSKENKRTVTFESEEDETEVEEPVVISKKGKGKTLAVKSRKNNSKVEEKVQNDDDLPTNEEQEAEPLVEQIVGKGKKGKVPAAKGGKKNIEQVEENNETEEPVQTTMKKGKRGRKEPAKTEVLQVEVEELPTKASTSAAAVSVPYKKGRGKAVKRGKTSLEPTVNNSESQECSSQPESKRRKQEAVSPSTPKRQPRGKAAAKPSTPGTPSLRRRTLDRKPKVMFTGVVDEEGQKIVKTLGGELVDAIDQCTHLVTDKVRRTVKFLCGVARGLLIVTPEWLEQCRDSKMFIDASSFLVSDAEAEKTHSFQLRKSVDLASEQGGLLQGYKVHVTKNVKPEPSQMKDIIQSACGEYLAAMPKKVDDASKVIVISCAADLKSCQAAAKLGVSVVGTEFILTGILKQEININKNRLIGDPTAATSGSNDTTNAKKKKR